jgi:hypothetical protein
VYGAGEAVAAESDRCALQHLVSRRRAPFVSVFDHLAIRCVQLNQIQHR